MPTVHFEQNISINTFIEVWRSHLHASFGTFCVQNGQLFESQRDFKLSKDFKIGLFFLKNQRFYSFQTFFKYSLWLQKITNLNAKGAKRSMKMWAINFYKRFFKNILLLMNGLRSKIRSAHTYWLIPFFTTFCTMYWDRIEGMHYFLPL